MTFVNEQFTAMMGFRRDQMIGRRFHDLTSEEYRDKAQKELDHRWQGESGPYDLELVRANGEKIFILCSPKPFYDSQGNYTGGVGLVSDITERKRVEEELQRSEERYRSFFENSSISLWEEDYSAVIKYMKGLCDSGVKDIRSYFNDYPEEIAKCSSLVRILNVNPATLEIYEAQSKKELMENLNNVFTQEALEVFKNQLILLLEGNILHKSDTINKTLTGREFYIHILFSLISENRVLVSVIDIDKQKRTEQALKYRDLQLKIIFNNISTSIYISDFESHKILFMNKHMKTLFGSDLTGKICWQSIRSNQSGPCEFCINDRLIDAEGNSTQPCIWENYNEKLERWYELHDQAIQWIDGRLVRLQIAIDITDRKKMETALQESHKRYRALADATVEAVFVSENGYCIDANSTAVKMFGYSHDELNGMFGTDVIAFESKEIVKHNILSGYDRPYEAFAQKKDGTKFHVEIIGKMIQYKNRKVRVTVVHDINERKLSEKALLKAHEELEFRVKKRTLELSKTNNQLIDTTNTLNNILSSSTEYAIVATDLSFRILLYNPAAERIFGYTSQEVVGKKVQELHTKEKVKPELFNRAIRDVRHHGIYECDLISKKSVDKKCFLHCIILPMKNENNDTTGYILFAQDITKIKKLQDRLVRSERLAATGQLAATIAHEINSPFLGIASLLDFLKEVYATDKKLCENLGVIKNGFNSIRNTVNKLMDLSRPGKEKILTLNFVI